MKVLLINNFFYRKGGSEVVFFNTANLLKAHGHKVVYFSFKRKNNLPCEQSQYFPNLGNKLTQIKNYFWNSDAAHQLEKLIVVEKPDIAHLHLFWGLMSPSIFGVLKKHHVPIVHTVHDYRMVCPAYTFKNNIGEICEKCTRGHFINCLKYKCCKGSFMQSILMTLEMYVRNARYHPVDNINGFIFVSKFARKKHIQHDERFKNATSIVLYNYTTPIVNYTDNKLDYILYYGRLSREKGVATLLEAIKKYPKIKLKIIGTGPIEEQLKSCYHYPNIEYLGFKSGKELFDIVALAKFVCVPSEWYENNPMTIIEAYSLGTPVIGAKIGGIPEIVVDSKTGYLFESGNVKSLEESLIKALNQTGNDYKTMSKASYNFYLDNFSENQYYKKLISFYYSIIGK